jgi:ribonuclease R
MSGVSRKRAAPRPDSLIGVVRITAGHARIEPFDADGAPVAVGPGGKHGAKDGDAVVATVQSAGRGSGRGRGRGGEPVARIDEVLGALDAPGVDVEIVARRHGCRREFPQDALVAAARLGGIPPKELKKRERFDSPLPVTIDGETARDFDDAIAVAEGPDGGFRLFVHVADVAWYVAPGSPIDREAKARGTSVYFPDRVLPMVPQRLADDLCSLRPGEDKLVQTVVVDFDRRGGVVAARFADGVIRSAARLTYGQVAAFLDGGGMRMPITPEIAAMLRLADLLRDRLEAKRRARGSIDFDLPAPMILLDVEGTMTGITIEPRNRAHRMIEEFMLAANEAVARWLSSKSVPCLFRVHEDPDPVKVEALAVFARSLGLDLRMRREGLRSVDVQRLLDSAEGKPAYPVVVQIALRTMKQARYAPSDTGHFGLAADHYLHFTSPIRRYPDLVAHRALRAARHGARARHGDLAELSEACSLLEREAEAAEREVLEWKKVRFLRGREGETFSGLVTGVARFGLFVQLDGGIAEGLVRVDRLGSEWFEYDAHRHELRGAVTGTTFRLGDPLEVRVERVDALRRRIDLAPMSVPPERGAAPRRPGHNGGGQARARGPRRHGHGRR